MMKVKELTVDVWDDEHFSACTSSACIGFDRSNLRLAFRVTIRAGRWPQHDGSRQDEIPGASRPVFDSQGKKRGGSKPTRLGYPSCSQGISLDR